MAELADKIRATDTSTGWRGSLWTFSAFQGSRHRMAYLLAVFLPVIELYVRTVLELPPGGYHAVILLVMPIAFCAFLGGLGPGMLATLVSGLVRDASFIYPLLNIPASKGLDGTQWMSLLIFGGLVSALSEARHFGRLREDADRQLMSILFSSIGDGIVTVDMTGSVTSINREAERLTGWRPRDATGLHVDIVVPIRDPRNREQWKLTIDSAANGPNERRDLGRGLLATIDGHECWVETVCNPLFTRNGAPIGWAIVFRDCAEKKRSDDLRRSQLELQQRLGHIADTVPGIIASIKMSPTGWISMPYASSRLEELYGVKPEEVVDSLMPAFRRIYPDDGAAIFESIHKSRETMSRWHAEYRVAHPSRGEVWVEGVSLPEREADGSVVWYGYFQDITERKRRDLALKESEERLRLANDAAGIGIWRHDLKTDTMQFDARAQRNFGFDGPDATFAQVLGRVHPADVERVREAIDRSIDAKRFDDRYATEFRAVHPNGKTVWLSVMARVYFEGDGDERHPVQRVGICRDITRRKVAQDLFHERNEQLAIIANNSPWPLARMDSDLRYVFANEAYCRWAGARLDQIVGLGINDVLDAEGANRARPQLQRALKGVTIEYENNIIDRNGVAKFGYITVAPEHATDGRVCGLMLMIADISERVEAENRLRDEHAHLSGLISSAMDAIVTVDSKYRITIFNPAAERMFGYQSQQVIGRRLDVLIAGLGPSPLEVLGDEVVPEAEGVVPRLPPVPVGKRADGESFPIEVSISVADEHEERFFTAIIRDITDRVHAEDQIRALNSNLERRVVERTQELKAANEELAAFSSSVTHDLRVPLRHIDGFAGLLEEALGDAIPLEAKRHLSRIQRSVKHMDVLINDILAMAKTAQLPMSRDAVDMVALTRECLETLGREMKGRSIAINVSEAMPAAFADVVLTRQVLLNLLGNAIKYTRDVPAAAIEVGCSWIDGETVYFVRDNGAGFDMAHAHKLFGVFQRLHSQSEFEGTGIGLATVKRIVVRHGGHVWAEAKPNEGATFYFTLEAKV